jgi:hypothetical protein
VESEGLAGNPFSLGSEYSNPSGIGCLAPKWSCIPEVYIEKKLKSKKKMTEKTVAANERQKSFRSFIIKTTKGRMSISINDSPNSI